MTSKGARVYFGSKRKQTKPTQLHLHQHTNTPKHAQIAHASTLIEDALNGDMCKGTIPTPRLAIVRAASTSLSVPTSSTTCHVCQKHKEVLKAVAKWQMALKKLCHLCIGM